MKTTHVIVSGSRPPKVDNRYVDFPPENEAFIHDVLDKGLTSDRELHFYHGMAAGVDTAVDNYFHQKFVYATTLGTRLRLHQFPAIWNVWNNDTKKFETNRFAGPQRNHAMIEAAASAAYNKPDHDVVLLAFYSTPTLQESKGTADAVNRATRKNITIKTFQLPVLNSTPTTPFD